MSVQPSRSGTESKAEGDRGGPRAVPLNPVDRAMLSVDEFLRAIRHPGFETQMVVWLDGKVDTQRLRRAIARLGAAHPLLVSRLRDAPNPHWRLDDLGREATLDEVWLDHGSEQAVLAQLSQGLGHPADPHETDPLRYTLVHRHNGPDVLVLQYNHTLLDNRATVGLIRHLDRMADDNQRAPLPAGKQGTIWQLLKRYDRRHRRLAAERAVDIWWRSIRGSAAMLSAPAPAPQRFTQVGIATRSLTAEQTGAYHRWVVDNCGMPTVSMAMLASVFRVMERLSNDNRRGTAWIAGLGVDLGLRRPGSVRLQNLMSIMPMRADRGELGDRQRLAQQLSHQMRSHLEQEIDLGTLQLIALFARRPRRMRWIIDGCMTRAFSLWYSYFGSLDAAGTHLLGVPVNNVYYIGPCWSPLGVTILGSQFQGRISLQASYLPGVVDPALAERLMDEVVADLLAA